MRQDRQDELVSTTAIVAGAVAGIVVTAVSLWLHTDELRVAPVDGPDTPTVEQPAATEAAAGRASAPEGWIDPRRSVRGPSALEWEVIRAFKPIESMTAREPGDERVDWALAELAGFADDHPDNPYIQELNLKGLRVAEYYATDAGNQPRAALLEARFRRYAALAPRYDGVVLETMAMHVQQIEHACIGVSEREAALRELSTLLGTESADLVLLSGQDAAARCAAAAALGER